MPQVYGFDKSACTGCGACGEICPLHCISMLPDAEGFLYPQVDSSRCTGCGRCGVACQVYNLPELPESTVAACICSVSDDEAATLPIVLSKCVIEDGGTVLGPFAANPSGTVCDENTDQEVAQAPEEPEYIENRAEGVYAQAKSILEAGGKVLYCATPCHIAGLKSFLGKEYGELYCYTRVCCGVSGNKVFGRYMESMKKGFLTQLAFVHFGRGSKTGCVSFAAGASRRADAETDLFLKGLTTGLFLRPSCHVCPFAGRADTGDIVLAPRTPDCTDENRGETGFSRVFLNTQKGRKLFERACVETSFHPMAEESGRRVLKRPPAPHRNRTRFFDEFESRDFSSLVAELTAPTGMKKAWALLCAACGERAARCVRILPETAAAVSGGTALQRLTNILRRVSAVAHRKKQ